ncbi:protein disulfide oxidoreductase [Salmonella enterica subsp. enterica serovar Choleraesuis]|nr:protein disulfide oxidoreductase [Salmonella enterica subsp. enterica serovar Choleraesuis]
MKSLAGRWARDLLVLLILLGVIMWGVDRVRAPHMPVDIGLQQGEITGQPSPSLMALSQDKPLLVYFWASWCAICKLTTPTVAALAADGMNVHSVALRSGDAAHLEKMLAARGLKLPLSIDPDGKLAASWGVSVTPTFVVLYRGELVSSTTGWSSSLGLKARMWMAQL